MRLAMPKEETVEVELIDYIKVILKRKWLIITGFLIAVVTAAVVSFLLPPVYESTAILEIGTIDYKPISSAESTAEILKSPLVQREVIKELNLNLKPLELEKKIGIKTKKNLITITAKAKSPQQAKEIANYFAKIAVKEGEKKYVEAKKVLENYMEELEKRSKEIEKEIKKKEEKISQIDASSEAGARELGGYLGVINSLEARIDSLRGKIQNSKFKISTTLRPTQVIRPATEPEYPKKPRKKLNVIIAGFLGLIVALGLAFFLEYWEKAKGSLKEKNN
jgi:uncharacterized protein involved in exopolysaccharide biosynthesis